MLHTKYRPQTLDDLIGNDWVKKSIAKTIGAVHTYLLSGTRGCGKTSTARIIARMLGINEFDIYEINIANNTGVDDARALIEQSYLLPMFGDRKVYILDEFHRATPSTQNVWLKTFEEPPEHCFFCLCTTEIDKVYATVRSRAAEYKVSPLTRRQIVRLLEQVRDAEGLDVPGEVLLAIAGNCDGIPREALVRLEMCAGLAVEEALLAAKESSPEDADVVGLFKAAAKRDWKLTARLLQTAKQKDPEQVRRALLTLAGNNLLTADNPGTLDTMSLLLEELVHPLYDSGFPGLVLALLRVCFSK